MPWLRRVVATFHEGGRVFSSRRAEDKVTSPSPFACADTLPTSAVSGHTVQTRGIFQKVNNRNNYETRSEFFHTGMKAD
jgi:hypothetical protein